MEAERQGSSTRDGSYQHRLKRTRRGHLIRAGPQCCRGGTKFLPDSVIPTQGLSALSPSGPQNLPLCFHLHDVLGTASGLVKSLAFGVRKAKFKAIL